MNQGYILLQSLASKPTQSGRYPMSANANLLFDINLAHSTNRSKSASWMHYWTTLSDAIISLSIMLGYRVSMIQLQCIFTIQSYKLTLLTSYIHVMHINVTNCQVEDMVSYHQEKQVLFFGRKFQWISLDLEQSKYSRQYGDFTQPSIPWLNIKKLYASTIRRLYMLRNSLKICGFHNTSLAQCNASMNIGHEF